MSNETVLTMVGNLTAEPDLRFLPDGTACCKFTVASTPRVLDKASGEYRDGEALFMPCTAWRDLGVHVAESLGKGARVVVQGRLRQSKWETPEGEKKSMVQLDVDEVAASLRFATAKVQKMARSKGDGYNPVNAPDERWDNASRTRPVPAMA